MAMRRMARLAVGDELMRSSPRERSPATGPLCMGGQEGGGVMRLVTVAGDQLMS